MNVGDNEIGKRGPGRPPRKEEVKKERRRRKTSGFQGQMRMLVPTAYKDFWKEYELRWINDQKGRVHMLTMEDDWDICYQHELPDAEPVGEGEKGTPIHIKAAGIGNDGKPYDAYLVRKRKDYFEADKAEKQAVIDEREKGLLSYKTGTGEGLDPAGKNVYVPSQS